MPRPVKYNKPRTTKFSEVQDNTLNKLASYKINVAHGNDFKELIDKIL